MSPLLPTRPSVQVTKRTAYLLGDVVSTRPSVQVTKRTAYLLGDIVLHKVQCTRDPQGQAYLLGDNVIQCT